MVGVVDADLGSPCRDPRAARWYLPTAQPGYWPRRPHRQEGIGLLQTFQPDHSGHEGDRFGRRRDLYAREIAERERAGLSRFRAPCRHHRRAATRAEATARTRDGLPRRAPSDPDIAVLGPGRGAAAGADRRPPPLPAVCAGGRKSDIQRFVRTMLADGPKQRGTVRVAVDIDP